MTENKRFVHYEHKGADYILKNPNTELDFIEMLGDCLEPKEIVDLLNKYDAEYNMCHNDVLRLEKENEQLKADKQLLIDFIKKEFPKSHKHILEGLE